MQQHPPAKRKHVETEEDAEDQESRELRLKYNQMISITEGVLCTTDGIENRQEFLQEESESLIETVAAANELFSHGICT